MQGTLTERNVPDLVVELYAGKRTGILRLTQGEVKKSIYFKEGSVVFAHSNLKQERLGEVLLRLGKISEEEFAQVADDLDEGRRLGQVLYEKGFLSPYEINSGVSYQVQQILYSVFNWDSGDYEFVDRERPVFEDIMVEVSTPALIIDGIRNINNLDVLSRAMGDTLNCIVVMNQGTKRFSRSNLDFSEETILACLDGKSTVEQLRSISRLSEQEFGRAMYLLTVSQIVLLKKPAPEQEARVREEVKKRWTHFTTEPIPPSESGEDEQARLKTLTEQETRKNILETLEKFRNCSDEEALQILPGSTTEEINAAYDRISQLFHPLYYSPTRYNDLKEQLKVIIDRLTQAQHNLLEKQANNRPLSEFDTREMPRPAFVVRSKGGTQTAVVATPVQAFPVTPPLAQSVIAAQQPAEQPAPPPKPPAPAVQRNEPAAPPKEAPAPAPVAPEPAPAPAVEEKPSIIELQASAKSQPDNTRLLRELGLRLQQAGKAREGEKHLLQALEREPRNIDNHFALADFYQAQGMKFQAFKHLNIILQIDPKNQRAMDLLGIQKRKKSLYEIGRK